LIKWEVDRIVMFDSEHQWKDGYAKFGFHDRQGNRYVLNHENHFVGRIGPGDGLLWTVASEPVFPDLPNIEAAIRNPMYLDQLAADVFLISCLSNRHLYRVDTKSMKADLLVDGSKLGMKDMGNCVLDDRKCIWVNEVQGCRVWRFDAEGNPLLVLGNGQPELQTGTVRFDQARFNWIYDIRRGPDGNIYVLDSKNFALRMIDMQRQVIVTLAGCGQPGYDGDGGPASSASFGSNSDDYFDGPYSLSLDKEGNIYIGDTHNHVVRMIERASGIISTIAGNPRIQLDRMNDPRALDPLKLNLVLISSMEYFGGRLFIPQSNVSLGLHELVILRKVN
jgi:hypothetical protein